MTTSKAFLGVLAGLATGTMFGLILASRRMNSRRKFSRVGNELGEALNDKIDERFAELVKALAGNMKQLKPTGIEGGKIEQEIRV